MDTIRLPDDFKEFWKLLNSNEVEYLLVGGYDVGYYGYLRATADIDLRVAMTAVNAQKLVDVLVEFGFDVANLSSDLFLTRNKVIRMGNPPIRIKLLTTIDGVTFEECFPDRITDQIDGVDVQIITLEHLKKTSLPVGDTRIWTIWRICDSTVRSPIFVVTSFQSFKEDLMEFCFGFLRKPLANGMHQMPNSAIERREPNFDSFDSRHERRTGSYS